MHNLAVFRQAHGIAVKTARYGQKALAFVVAHDVPHNNTSTEIYRDGGAFTLVPLPMHENRHASAVVWMDHGRASVDRKAATPEALAAEATTRSCHILGDLTLISPVGSFPIITQIAERMTAERTILLAEAAHVLPPIGAQGLNTSLADVAALGALVDDHAADPGSLAFLTGYRDLRARDIATRARVIDAFNRMCRSGHPAAQSLRQRGLAIAHDVTPLRNRLMQAGLGH